MLKPGDPCPCCGQPIKTSDPEILSLLTYIQDDKVNQEAAREFLSAFRSKKRQLDMEGKEENKDGLL